MGRVGSTKCSLSHIIQIYFSLEDCRTVYQKDFPPLPISTSVFFMSEASGEDEEQMQYHLYSSCSSSEVKVEIQALTQWSGGKRLSEQVKVHYLYNILRP